MHKFIVCIVTWPLIGLMTQWIMGSGGTENKQSRSYMIIFFNIMKWLNCQVYITVVFLSSFNILGSEKRPRECCNVWRVNAIFLYMKSNPRCQDLFPNLEESVASLSILTGLWTEWVTLNSVSIDIRILLEVGEPYFSNRTGPLMASTRPYFLFLVEMS